MLVASLLRHYKTFVKIIANHPSKKYILPSNHLFVSTIQKACHICDISEDLLSTWIDQVNQGFIRRNIAAVPIELVKELDSKQLSSIQMDMRTFVDHFNVLTTSYYSLTMEHQELKKHVSTLESKLEEMNTNVLKVLEIANTKVNMLSAPPAEVMRVPRLSVSLSRLHSNMSNAQLFVEFFLLNVPKAYAHDKAVGYQGLDNLTVRKIQNSHLRMKMNTRVMLFFAPECPQFPSDDEAITAPWLEHLKEIARIAEQGLVARVKEICPDKAHKKVSVSLTHKYEVRCVWEDRHSPFKLFVPQDTPDEMLEYLGLSPSHRSLE